MYKRGNTKSNFIVEKIDELNKYSSINDSIINLLQNKIQDYEEKLFYLDSKVQTIDSYVSYIDSIHSNISNSLLIFQDDINLLRSTYSEISEVSSLDNIKKFPPIDDEEFKDRYLSSLALFQNGEWEKSIEGFNYLLNTSSNNSLLDNCQYWVGEIYFKMKKYHLSIKEFEKVFLYMDSNKRDDSLYKIAKSYILLNDEFNANISLNDLIQNYPNSEYVKKAKELLK
tara:strand:+ start:15076 stop:15756 length:681 start_codon:yes stop_codon:yes gene_type:complete